MTRCSVVVLASFAALLAGRNAQPRNPAAARADSVAARIDSATTAVERRLKDPESAQFRAVRESAPASTLGGKTVICGYVNARNSFNGYSGYQHFMFSARGAELLGDPEFEDRWMDLCRE